MTDDEDFSEFVATELHGVTVLHHKDSPPDPEDEHLKTIHEILRITLYEANYDQGLAICDKYFGSEEFDFRINCLRGLGHLSRLFGKMDLDFALPHIRKALDSSDPEEKETARNILEELEINLDGFDRRNYGFPEDPELTKAKEEWKRLFAEDDDDED